MSERMEKVLPGRLRLPPSRRSGPDPFRLNDQVRRYGGSAIGMPPIQVTLGKNREMMINDGVTRAFRVHRFGEAGAMVEVEVIDERSTWSLEKLPRVSEV